MPDWGKLVRRIGERLRNIRLLRKRQWFRFHLSTAIMLMFVAGGVLWANLHHRVVVSGSMIWCGPVPGPPGSSGAATYQRWGYGFPFEAVGTNLDVQGSPLQKSRLNELSPRWHVVALLGDLALGIVVVLLVGSACEWLIRRRERGNETAVARIIHGSADVP